MTRGCGGGWVTALGLVGLMVLAGGNLGCRKRQLCPSGYEETRVSGEAVWCKNAAAKTSVYLLFHPGTRHARQRCTFTGGALDGPFEAAHPGGQRLIEGRYSNGQLAGKWVQWDVAGRKVAEGEYREGRLVGGAPVAVASLCAAVPHIE